MLLTLQRVACLRNSSSPKNLPFGLEYFDLPSPLLALLDAPLSRSTNSLDRPPAVASAHLAEVSYACDRLRLEIRPPQQQRRQALYRENTPIALETTSRSDRTTTDPANRCEGRSSHVDAATATKGFTLTSVEARSGSGSALEESEHRVHVPQAPPPLPYIASGRAYLDPGCAAASTDGRCYHQCSAAPVVFAQDLTHSEVDALVGPTLAWKDPFKV